MAAWVGPLRRESTREENAQWVVLATKMKVSIAARVVGRGEKPPPAM